MKTDTTPAFKEHLKRIKVAKDTTDLFSQMQLATELDMQVRQYQRFEYGEE